jgi:folate-binding protein YgfZ
MGEYRGAETATNFGDVNAELDALSTGCALFDLTRRAKFFVTGPDRARWLNGMVTNNIRDLAAGHGSYNFVLNPQGRIQGDLYVFNRGDSLLIDTEACQREKLREFLGKYIIMDDVEISSADDKLTAIGLAGPLRADFLKAISLPADLEPLHVCETKYQNLPISLMRADRGHFEIWMDPRNATEIWSSMIAAGAKPVGSDAIELARIAAGIPRYGVDIRDRDLPQETGQSQALNFNKGCYVGQEIVERIHSRGAVHRSFTGFIFDGPLPTPGAKVQSGGKEVGELTSVASLPSRNGARMIGLGYIRREAAAAGAEMSVDGTKAKALSVPFKNL